MLTLLPWQSHSVERLPNWLSIHVWIGFIGGHHQTLLMSVAENIYTAIRELADTRNEFGASKAIIVTSSHLTRGALDRIERDKYVLGKVDREELQAWIQRTLLGGTLKPPPGLLA